MNNFVSFFFLLLLLARVFIEPVSATQVYFTQDGKEYVTPEQLESEIHDELLQHGGKLGILNLPTLLNVDLSYIEARLSDMLKRSRRLQIVNGEIMTRYIPSLLGP